MFDVDAGGIVSTYVGIGGKIGKSDGPCNQALLNLPHGVALDLENTLYFTDRLNHRICVVRNGMIVFE